MVLFNRRKYMVRRRSPQGAPADISDATITVADSVQYTGTARYPAVTVVYDGATLVVNTHYTLNYVDNTELGAATVTITGMGDFAGSVIKTFQIVAASGGSWANFDLSDLGLNSHVASKQLYDRNAVYSASNSIDAYSIQLLPDGRLLFGAQAQGHVYIWGFDDGHPFEVEHFKSTYDSRSYVASFNCSFIMPPDGLTGVRSYYGSGGLSKVSLSTAFDLSAMSAGTTVAMASGYAEHMAFSSDGMKFFYKKSGDDTLYCRNLHTPYIVDDFVDAEIVSVDLDSAAGDGVNRGWNGFCFSPDGIFFVATSGNESGNGNGFVHKFALSDPWNIETAERVSSAQLFGGQSSLEAVIVNAEGTKMIVCDNKNHGAYGDRTFYEYNLT